MPECFRGCDEYLKYLCNSFKAQLQRAEPLIPTPLPKLPWQKIATDLFLWKNNCEVLTVDYYSRYIEIALLNRISSTEVITKLKSIIARHGIREVSELEK